MTSGSPCWTSWAPASPPPGNLRFRQSSGTALARAVCGFLALFWLLRLIAAIWILDVNPYLRSRWHRLGYHAINVVFGILPFFYGWLALRSAAVY